MRTAARVLSIALHPLLMPTLTLWLALNLDPHLFVPPDIRWVLLGMVALMTIAFPITSALLLLRSGLLTSMEMPTRRERTAPYGLTLLYFGMIWYLLARMGLHPAALALFMGAFAALLLTMLINLKWKISAHMVGIGGCLGAMVALSGEHSLRPLLPISVIIIAAGTLGTARLLTSDHTPAQVYVGAVVGFACAFAGVTWS